MTHELELRFFDRTGTVQPVRVPGNLSVLQVKQLLVARDGFGQDLAPEHLTLSVGRQRLADGVVVERLCADGYPIGIAVAAADGIRKPGADPKWLDDVGLAVARVNLGVTVDGEGGKTAAGTAAQVAEACHQRIHCGIEDYLYYSSDAAAAAARRDLEVAAAVAAAQPVPIYDVSASIVDLMGLSSSARTGGTAATLFGCDCGAHTVSDGVKHMLKALGIEDWDRNRSSNNTFGIHLLEAAISYIKKHWDELKIEGVNCPDPCTDTRFEAYAHAADYLDVNGHVLLPKILKKAGFRETSNTFDQSTDQGAMRTIWALTNESARVLWAFLGELNFAVVRPSLQFLHAYRSLRFDGLGRFVLGMKREYCAIAYSPKATGLFPRAYARARAVGVSEADVDVLVRDYCKAFFVDYVP